nr:polysaccharide biosynthesis tyrosine autokinase [Actinopolymorpha pittospori]
MLTDSISCLVRGRPTTARREIADSRTDSSVELRDYLKVLRRRWAIIVACAVLATAAAVGVTLNQTPQYASTVRLFVSTPNSTSSDAYQGGLFSEQRAASYAEIVTGPEVARAVVDRLGLKQSPASLQSRTDASVVPNTVILKVTITDPVQARARVLVQAVAQEFIALVQKLERSPNRAGSPINASLLGAPVTSSTPVSPVPPRNVGLGAVLGLLLGVGLAALREAFDTKVRDPDELMEFTNAPLLGTVHFDNAVAKKGLITSFNPRDPLVEVFRVLRTNLQFVRVDQPSKMFVVTSAVAGDGKTTTACNLAISLARAGYRVALVEGDLRRPGVATGLGLERAAGLTTVLIGRLDVAQVMQKWGEDGLSVLTSGALPPHPAELLQSRAMSDVLADLRKSFDVVLIDAPPLLPVTDAALLAAQSDGAILVVRHGATSREQVRMSLERLTSVHARLVGTVLNRSPKRQVTSYAYSYEYAPVRGRHRPPATRSANSERTAGKSADPEEVSARKPANGGRAARKRANAEREARELAPSDRFDSSLVTDTVVPADAPEAVGPGRRDLATERPGEGRRG